MPGTAIPTASAPETGTVSSSEQPQLNQEADDDWTDPKPDWNRIHYEIAYMQMLSRGDRAGASKVSEAYLASGNATEGDNRATWEAFSEYRKIVSGTGGSIAILQSVADANPANAEVQTYLAQAYERYQDFSKAAQIYEAAAGRSSTDSQMREAMGSAAVAYMQRGMPDRASKIVSDLRNSMAGNGDGERQLLRILHRLAELSDDQDLSLATWERMLQLEPTDSWTRFSLAYAHSHADNKDLALLHYLRIPYHERTRIAWNNLGVSFDEFGIRAKSVTAYRKSEEAGETLAMSNLSLKFMAVGFIDEAEAECNKAINLPEYHKNIGHTLAKLKDVPEEEDKKQEEILKEARPKSEFYQQVGHALSRPEPIELADRWKGPDCVLEVTLREGKFEAVGSYETRSGLNSLLTFGEARGGAGSSVQHQVSYSGTLQGRAIQAHVKRTRKDAPQIPTTLLSVGHDEIKVLMVIVEGEREISVAEFAQASKPRFYSLRPVETN
jgi:tetratricopeptide (TPR) repeat protein